MPCPVEMTLDVRDVPNDLKHWKRKPRRPRQRVPGRSSHLAAQVNFDFLGPPGGVGESLGDVLGFQVGVLAENLVARTPCGDEPDHRADRDTHAPDARLSAHYGGGTSDARQLWHVEDSEYDISMSAKLVPWPNLPIG
jgi:hypothetical protein